MGTDDPVLVLLQFRGDESLGIHQRLFPNVLFGHIAGLSLGPSRVTLFIGRNKLVENLDRAIYRARNVASPALAIQLGKDTPCVKTGRCHDCASPDRICNNLSVIERCNPEGRIRILFINEDLGL